MKIIPFNNPEFGEIRVVRDKYGEPWFVAKDVARILGYRKASDMVRNLDEDEAQKVRLMDESGRIQEMTIINESGIYSSILTSRKLEAKRFKKWVTSEVLPSIRKTGKYELKKTHNPNDELREKRLLFREIRLAVNSIEISPEAKQVALAKAAQIAIGDEIIPLPPIKQLYTATDIAQELGISAKKVGMIARRINIYDDEKYGKRVLDQSKHSSKQITNFLYNEDGRALIMLAYEEEKNRNGEIIDFPERNENEQ